MPIKANAKKALRQSKKRKAVNDKFRSAYRDTFKKVTNLAENGKVTPEMIKETQKKLGKAAKRGVIKKKTASRKLSRLMKKINKQKTEVKK